MPVSNPSPATLVWLRRDLRSFDHAALHRALQEGGPVYCAFVFDTPILAGLPREDRRVAFIHATLTELASELEKLGGHLIVRHGDARDVIPALAAELGAATVHANDDYDPQAIARDRAIAAALEQSGRRLCLHKDHVILHKEEVLSQAGKPLTVFTPYKNAWLKKLNLDPSLLAPLHVDPYAARLAPGRSTLPTLAQLGFDDVDLAAIGIEGGMTGGAAAFDAFVPKLAPYGVARDFPAQRGTSQLSLHLRFGTVSIRHVVRTIRDIAAAGHGGDGGAVWLAELIWREFYQQILYHFPHVVRSAFKPVYDRIQWETGAEADAMFAAWCEARTGYPLVDAAMLQLHRTGFMHNRLRMVTASFLVKDLGIDWRRGEAWFALKLNDYELASNNGGWQWAASSGCDAQPFFRIFNPVTQSQKFDAEGTFIKSFLPQLGKLNAKEIHAPWLAPGKAAGYPPPIVQHDVARQRTLERYAVVKA